MGQADQLRREWRETTDFMRSLVRFATADPSVLADSAQALPSFFNRVFIGPQALRHEFVRWGLTPVPHDLELRRATSSMLRSLQKDLSLDLKDLADATGVWRQMIPAVDGGSRPMGGRRFIVKMKMKTTGKEVAFDATGAVVALPDPVRRRIQRHLPRFELTSIGRIEPVLHKASLRQLLYYALAIALSCDVLLHSRKCSYCGTLVVHYQRPTTLRPTWFCAGVGRDCKTAYHNAHKNKVAKAAAQSQWRANRRARLQRRRNAEQTVGALERFLAATRLSPDSSKVTRVVRQIGAGGLSGWKLVRNLTERHRRKERMEAIWQSLSDKAKAAISEGWGQV